MEHYKSLNSSLREKFGHKLYKLALDGGFTCPNRDGTVGTGGCIFCSGSGSGDFAESACTGITDAADRAMRRVESKNPGGGYIAYFQNYTGTYAPVEKLRSLFTEAIELPYVEVLSVATRPDCLPYEVIELLAELNRIKPVWIELGLQTVHPETAAYIRRGYDLPVFDSAVRRLKAAGIEVIVHMIIGLPGESDDMIYKTAEYIGRSGADGVKFQLLHVLRGTDLAADYEKGLFSELSLEKYITLLEGCIRRISPEMTVHRITDDGAKRILIAPLWSGDKKHVLNEINRAFERDNLVQGELFGKT